MPVMSSTLTVVPANVNGSVVPVAPCAAVANLVPNALTIESRAASGPT